MKFTPFKIGKYQFEELLAKGGMGEIYLVRVQGAQGFQKQFAVKRMIKSGNQQNYSGLAFQQEAKLCSMLTHPNIAQVFDFVRTGKSSLLVMEYVNGRDLSQILKEARAKEQRIPVPFAVYVVAQVAKGLEYAHTRRHPETDKLLGIVHRDVSPQNIMIAQDGTVKLIDFGVARVNAQPFKTATGFIKGKPRYMSPEQAKAQEVDLRTDIYGLGLVLLEVLAGQPAFKGTTQLEIFKKVQNGLWSQELLNDPRIPGPLEQCIRRCLKSNPSERFSTAHELVVQLEQFLRVAHAGYGEIEASQYLAGLFEGTSKNYDANREVEPFSLAERRCLERGGLEQSSLSKKMEATGSLFKVTLDGIFHSELSWILGGFLGLLFISAAFMAWHFTRLKQQRELATLQGCSEEYALVCPNQGSSKALQDCIQKEIGKLSEACRPTNLGEK